MRVDDVTIQRRYYDETSHLFDDFHLRTGLEHRLAQAFLLGVLDHLEVKSVLDVGAGTGRTVAFLKEARPDIRVVGVEPSAAQREVAYGKGISRTELIEGDGTQLAFGDGAFDLVCSFGVLHHIKRPQRAVAEMLRVSRTAVFISDSNNFGQGSWRARAFKQAVNAIGLWPLVVFLRTKGKGYVFAEGDGLFYSYSVFNNYRQIRRQCRSVHVVNTQGTGINPYRSADHVALLGIKK
jgi:ubiquinone/menaquinone biosynthesis C-methylase UbiE